MHTQPPMEVKPQTVCMCWSRHHKYRGSIHSSGEPCGPGEFCIKFSGHLVRQCNTDLSILRWMLQYEKNVLCLLMSIMNSWPMSDYCELVQILYIFMSLRNRETPRDEFIFYSKRLMRLLFEYALSMLPHKVRKSLIFH